MRDESWLLKSTLGILCAGLLMCFSVAEGGTLNERGRRGLWPVKEICLSRGALDECKVCLLTETNAALRASQTRDDLAIQFRWDLGVLRKFENRRAVGGTLGLIYDTDDDSHQIYTVALKLRLRQGISDEVYLELSPGMTLGHIWGSSYDSPTLHVKHPQFLASASLGLGDYLAFVVHYEDSKFTREVEPYSSHTIATSGAFHTQSWYFGIRFGGTPGIVLAPIALLLSGYFEGLKGLRGME